MCTLLCFAITIVGTMALFKFFTTWDGCTTNKIFIGINAGLSLFLSVISVLICCGPSKRDKYLFQLIVMLFLMANCDNRRNTFCLTTVGYHISLYNLLDVDGRVEYSKRADSIS